MLNAENELFKAIQNIDAEKLSRDDLHELLTIFKHTNNSLIRDCIALFFYDLKYDKAVPSLIKLVTKKELIGNNGTLLFALTNLDSKKYFLTFIEILCTHGYLARLHAYEIVEKYAGEVSTKVKKKAIEVLNEYIDNQTKEFLDEAYQNSTLCFIQAAKDVLEDASK